VQSRSFGCQIVWLEYVFRGGVVVACLDVGYKRRLHQGKLAPARVCRRRLLESRPSNRNDCPGAKKIHGLPTITTPASALALARLLYPLMGIEVAKMVARQRNLQFASQAVSIGSLMGIRPLYLLMDIKSAKVCTSPKIFFRASRRPPVAPPSGRATNWPSNLLMHIDSAKTSALPPKSFCQDALSVITVPERGSNSPSYLLNAQRLGENGRLT
jgi:hypothetical protein